MGNRNTAWGNKAYKEVRKEGGSKQEAKQAAQDASERYYNQTRERQFSNSNDFGDVSDFNNTKNDGRWHTSEDL